MVSAVGTLPRMQPGRERPWIIAHRGASAARHENTIAAFTEAALRGADAVEFDVRRTADDVLVIHHDDRVPDVGPIIDLTFAELRPRAPWIPTFDEAMAACAGMWVDVEVKNSPTDRDWDPGDTVLEAVLERLAEAGSADRVLISSFNPATAARAIGRIPGLQTGLLVGTGIDPLEAASEAAEQGHAALLPHSSLLQGRSAARVVEAAAHHRVGVVAWTVDDPESMRRLADAGIAGIITNVPNVARSVLGDDEPDRTPRLPE